MDEKEKTIVMESDEINFYFVCVCVIWYVNGRIWLLNALILIKRNFLRDAHISYELLHNFKLDHFFLFLSMNDPILWLTKD